MKKRIITLALAIIIVFQTIMPVAGFAKENTPEQNKMVKVGTIDTKSYPQLDAKIVQDAIRRKKLESKGYESKMERGAQLFSAPYFPNQDPTDKQKPLIFANVNAIFTTKGLDGGNFDWEGVFGKDSDGKQNKAQIVFEQLDDKTSERTGVKFFLKVDKAGKYTWTDSEGKPTKLPLYSTDLKPYRYEVLLDEDVSEHVKLLTARFFGTSGGYAFGKPDPVTGEIVGYINLDLTLQQIASTKFTSKWNTGVAEADRPIVEGSYLTGYEKDPEDYGIFKFPSNDTDKTIIRNEKLDPQNPGEYSEYRATELDKTPTVDVADPDPDATDTYTIDRDNKKISYKGKTYKYEFKYDVINGGKLIMTEVIPVTFDTNGGKFKNFTAPDTETKIVKEVEYDGTLTDKAEDPTKDRETFKGWSDTKGGTTPVTDEVFKNIKEAKTFYAIWDNNDILADPLEVKESFKADGATEYTNDFIPTLDKLKGQVKIKDANGTPQALTDDDTLQILDDSGNPIADADLKDKLYEKLKEDDATEVSKDVILKAKVTHKNGTTQEVDIPIKVIKNIYEGTSTGGKPSYVPDNYVKVTVDPTDKAKEPQKTYYYVNPAAKVVIPGEDPTGTGDNTFTKWLIDGTENVYELSKKPRNQFKSDTTIKAQYVSDVIPAKNDGSKADGTPDNFVKVTFVPTDKAKDETPKIFYVNPKKDVTIPIADPEAKATFTFKEWKMGADAKGAVYTPSTAQKFTEATTVITATYEEGKNIIPYDPSVPDPMPRPEGYVRVTFKAEKGLDLTEQKAYYVKKNAKDTDGNPITLGNSELIKPAYKEETGYKFKEWDQADTVEIKETDILVTAKPTKFDPVIPEKDDKGNPNPQPADYKVVTFVIKDDDKTKGSIDGVAKFYVNPTEYVTINPPTTKANTGFEFGTWDKDATISTVYKEDTTITGSFNGLKDVIPNKNPDGSENTKPEGYKTVTFVIDPVTGGKIAENEVTVYYVNPAKEVTVPQPKTAAETGYDFEKWDQDTTKAKKYDKDTTVKGKFKKLDDIIPSTNDEGKPNEKPEGYVTLTFEKGEHGKEITGQTVYYVNPNANISLGNVKIVKPTVTPKTGWEQKAAPNAWDKKDSQAISEDLTVTAQYEELKDIIPQEKTDGSDKPAGYITVTFEKGANGELEGKTVFYINPNKGVVLEGNAPTIKPNTGYTSAGWDTSINKAIQYKDGDKITALYNELGDVIPQEKTDGSDKPAGYLTVTFVKGDHGELSGKTVYYVKPNKKVTVPAPTVTPAVGYEFDKWDKALTQTFTAENTTIKAQYKALDDVIPGDQRKPDGYKTVKFVGENGTLSGTTVYYVNPNKDVDFTKTANDFTKKPDFGYTEVGGTWDSQEFKKKFTDNETTFTFKFKELPKVIPAAPGIDKPEGYVTVEFITDGHGSLSGITKYYVRPFAGIIVGKDIKIPQVKAKADYKFNVWLENISGSEEVTGDRLYVATFTPEWFDPSNPVKPVPVPVPERLGGSVMYLEKVVKVPVPDNAYVKEVRYMQGFKGDFRPKDGLTRAEAAQILANALVEDGYKFNRNYDLPYKDIGEAWYTEAVKIVTEAKVFAGYDDGNFKPQDKITRNEWIATLKRFQELGDESGNHMKLKDGHWAMSEIEAAYKAGWLKIYFEGNANYEGDKFIPREEVAAVSNKAFKRVLDKSYIRNNDKNLISYKDVKKDMWSYEDILCASNTFLYKKDLYRAHWIKEDNNEFNINTYGFEIVKAKFQRNPR